MEGKPHRANENRRRMMNNGPHHTQRYRNNSSGGFTPRHNKPPAQNYRPNYTNHNGGPPKPGGNHNHHSNNNNSNPNNTNNHPNGNNNNPNTAPRTGSNTVPINPKHKSTVNCYECGVVGHYSNECPKKLARLPPTSCTRPKNACRRNNNNGRLYHMNAEAQKHLSHAKYQSDQMITMPALLSPTMPSPSPFISTMPHHVLEVPYVTLNPLVHTIARDTHHTAQATRAQTSPAPARIGMDARQDALDTTEHGSASSPQTLSPSLLAPAASP
ncbi:hypothetical protein QYE76_028865 [Lolium multiflorum]|uniref:CCHC-type domain-containing protein n=1 Tax=Lolium multiflorum TaxID=4521 RepID=A0AAD8VEZ4_LOLMU|nr:hypothetical protein QYE76_028865 [Lolium multiflorum]